MDGLDVSGTSVNELKVSVTKTIGFDKVPHAVDGLSSNTVEKLDIVSGTVDGFNVSDTTTVGFDTVSGTVDGFDV